ncbi:hypothetical protein CARUB_v10011904mg [Capsella rubella]|uniref:Uncharacterized protein n=1 Tax=Capsella rubella TaxID=81985 RepID=R0I326_9BRAS|nr:uncharacterized protein LOC17896748 [Capsella rubella]EOA36644.1 hypothetical protein CARUB_v10011904mg [Capsella rubella]
MVPVFASLIHSVMVVFIVLESMTTINARELRPSDHGLEYYYEPGESSSSGMTTFFGPPSSNDLKSTTSSSSPSGSILPSAVKSPLPTTTTLPKVRDDDDDDHAMNHVLVVGSLVCGISGVALIVASALIYFLGYPKTQNSSVNCDHIHNNVTNTK